MEHGHRSNRRLIAVFSLASNDEWIDAERIARAKSPQSILSWDNAQTRLIPATTGSESYVVIFELGNYTLALAKEDGAAFVRERESAPIDIFVQTVIAITSFNERYVAVHDLAKYIKDRYSIEEKVDVLANFHHTQEYEGLRASLNDLLSRIDRNDTGLEAHCQDLQAVILGLSKEVQIKRVSVLKHKIANCFLPVDIDLQGWKDTGFNVDYGTEISAAYTNNSSPLVQAQEQLYDGPYRLGEIIKGRRRDEVKSAIKDLESLLPKTKFDSGDESFRRASMLLDELHAGRLERVKQMLSDSDPFHSWFEKLMSTLDELRDAMAKHLK